MKPPSRRNSPEGPERGKRVVLLGSTGSIGRNVLDVVSHHTGDFEIAGLAARNSAESLARQCAEYPSALVAMSDAEAHDRLLATSPELKSRSVGCGPEALTELIERARPDLVVNALVGFVGLKPTIAAINSGIPVAIANKETIVAGGEILQGAAKKTGADLIPIDSEHVAIGACLRTEPRDEVERVVMTASGGALRARSLEDIASVTVEDVLAHPTWDMGQKVTVDSATLVNKGLEIIEAHWLFDLPYEKIDVVIHPQSVVHSFVEFIDGSILAQMSEPDMRLPILYALSYPGRYRSHVRSRIQDFPELTFSALDARRYPCFGLARAAAAAGGNAPTVLNAANEVAVAAFLSGDIAFQKIYGVIEGALAAIPRRKIEAIEDIFETDHATREWILQKFEIKPTEVG